MRAGSDADAFGGAVAIVTGAGSIGPGWGNGKATAVQCAREGAAVLADDISEAAATETQDLIRAEGHVCEVAVADVSRPCDVEAYGTPDTHALREARAAPVPLNGFETAWDAAHADVFLASDDNAYVTGVDLFVDGGLTSVVPQPPGPAAQPRGRGVRRSRATTAATARRRDRRQRITSRAKVVSGRRGKEVAG